ncbi:MAG: hypothetical protein ACTTH7_05370 [Treponema sp.]
MKKPTLYLYIFACVYETVKVFYIASFSIDFTEDILFFKYSALAALCVPVLPWLMLLVQEKGVTEWLYMQFLLKFLTICGEFLYIFHRGFVIMHNVVNAAHSNARVIKAVFLFLAIDTVLLFFAYIKGSMSYANHTDC